MDPIPETRDPRPYSEVLPPPPPPRASGGDGCWKWGAIGCGMGCLSLAILGAAMIYMFMPLMNTSTKIDAELGVLRQDMQTVGQAINEYREANGTFPATLKALVPKYLSGAESLKSSQHPSGPEFKYTRPAASSPEDAPILEYAMPFRLPDGSTAPILMRLLRSGQFAREEIPEPYGNFIEALRTQRRGSVP